MKFTLLKDAMRYDLDTIKVDNYDYDIINLNSSDLEVYDRLLAEFDCKVPATFLKNLPFDFDYKFSSSKFADYQNLLPTGIHYSNQDLEAFKVFIPKGNIVTLIGTKSPNWEAWIKIELEFYEPRYDSIIEFSTKVQSESDNSSLNVHLSNDSIDPNPHLDTQLGVNLQHTKIELSATQALAINQRSGVVGNTYIDQSGRLFYIGNHHA